jgi:transposase InsO family protein
MGRVGAGGDNAAVEPFFTLLQKKALNRRSSTTRMEPLGAIVVWIERKYHRKRPQAALGRLTPIEFETITVSSAALAAGLKLSPKPASGPNETHGESNRLKNYCCSF